MHEMVCKINRLRALKVCEGLKGRNMKGVYFDEVSKATHYIDSLIKDGSTVGLGGSVTLVESGLLDILRKRKINLLDRYKEGISKEDVDRMRVDGLTADVFIASANAITITGKIVNADGMGNRVASMIFGPKKVILFAGVNKIVDTVSDAIKRIHSYVAPMNALRFNAKTKCAETGFCDEENCDPDKRICNAYSIIAGQNVKDRITVVIAGKTLGF